MSEQQIHIPAEIREALTAAEQRAHEAWERDKEATQIKAQMDDLKRTIDGLERDMRDLEQRRTQAREKLARHSASLAAKGIERDSFGEAARRYRRMAELLAAEEGVALPVPSGGTGPQPAVTSGGHPIVSSPERMSQVCAEGLHDQCQGHDSRGGCHCPSPAHAQVLRFDQGGLLPMGEHRPVLPDGDTTTTRADTPLPVPPAGGDPAADASFHRGDPDPSGGERGE